MKNSTSFYKKWLEDIALFSYILVIAILSCTIILFYKDPSNTSQQLLYIPEIVLLLDIGNRIRSTKKFKNASLEQIKTHIYIFAFGFKRMFSLLIYLGILPFALLENPHIALIPIILLFFVYLIVWFFIEDYLAALAIMIKFTFNADLYLNRKIANGMITIGKSLFFIFSVFFIAATTLNITYSTTIWSLLVFYLYMGITTIENGTRLKSEI